MVTSSFLSVLKGSTGGRVGMVCGTLRRKVGVPQVFHVGLPVGFFGLPRLGCYTFQHYSDPDVPQ